jgi:hypothetical protein
MGSAIVVAAFFLVWVLWAFCKFVPAHPPVKQVQAFNLMCFGMAAFAGLIWWGKMYFYLQHHNLEKYTPLVAVAGGIALAAVLLLIALPVRNFYVFRGQSNRPGKW